MLFSSWRKYPVTVVYCISVALVIAATAAMMNRLYINVRASRLASILELAGAISVLTSAEFNDKGGS